MAIALIHIAVIAKNPAHGNSASNTHFFPAPLAELTAPSIRPGAVDISPTLRVMVTNSSASPLTVTFYGGQEPVAGAGPDFSIVVLPDTQFYTSELRGGTKEMLISQTEWAVANRLNRNVAYVAQLGDLTQNGDSKHSQWCNATNGFYRLEDPVRTQLSDGIPYGIAVGNHDLYPIGDPAGTSIYYNKYFGAEHFSGKNYYGGHYGTNNNNHFDLFSASGLDFIVFHFEYYRGGDTNALEWAQQVLSTNANRRIIAITHFMGTIATPSVFSPQGLAIYNALKSNTNLFLLLGGHLTGEASRTDTYKGNAAYTFIQDFQGRTNGGSGWMRIFDFSPSNNVVSIQTYSPFLNRYETDANSEMYFPYNMQESGETVGEVTFAPFGTNTGVLPGSMASHQWPGLKPYTKYQWYAVAADDDGNAVRSPVWHFATDQGDSVNQKSRLARHTTPKIRSLRALRQQSEGSLTNMIKLQ